MLFAYYGYWDYWQLYHKVTFDGINKLISINSGEALIDVKIDVYSDWKEWVQLGENAKYLPAIRSIGGDPTKLGQKTGDIYFLMNGWRIIIPHGISFSGVLYSDDGLSPFTIHAGGGVEASVSNLVLGTNPDDLVSEIDANSQKLAETISRLEAVAAQITNVPSNVWNTTTSDHVTPNTFGYFIQKKLLTFAKYIGIK